VRERQLPILLEESLENTVFFLEELAPDLKVIIPHLGGLSGGYVALDRAGVWRRSLVYADTAVAALPEIKDFIRRFGTGRLIFGSDYPFGSPASELNKILSLNLPEDQTRAILGDNFRKLCRLT
jgi:predicted TIM-barrel fold metal-dependent hydrolase